MTCPLCQQHEDTEKFVLMCIEINKNMLDVGESVGTPNYDDVFSQNLSDVIAIGKVFHKAMELRKSLLGQT